MSSESTKAEVSSDTVDFHALAVDLSSKLATLFARARAFDEGPKVVEEEAPARVDAVDDLAKVRERLGVCERCDLCKSRTSIVFGEGPSNASLFVLGEAPGRLEDEQGRPFVGPAGEKLDKMLKFIDIARADAYITNVVKCRPPENKDPLPDQIEACGRFLRQQIEVVAPKVILVLGTVAFRSLLGKKGGVTRNRGEWLDYKGIPVMATFHPAFLLRQPGERGKVMEDLLRVKARLEASKAGM